MPNSKNRRIKNPEQYEALRKKGMSKEKAARIVNAGKSASVKGGKSPKYEDWTKKDLLEKAKEVGIEHYSRMNKQALIDALRNN